MNRKRLLFFGVVVLAVLALGGCAAIYDLFTQPSVVGTIAWGDDAREYNGNDYMRYTFTLPAGGSDQGCWGTDIYTDDSSIGTAAVHAGLITFAVGGNVTIRILPGRSSYNGTTANGVTSTDYGEWDGSFEFIQ